MNASVVSWPRQAWRTRTAAAGTREWVDVVVIFAALIPITLVCYAVDERTLLDVSVWSKPLKFQLSLALHFATLAVLFRLIPTADRYSIWLRFAISASALAALLEIFWIMFQAARGRASHFNQSTELQSAMYALMGIGSLLLVLAPLVAGIAILRNRDNRAAPLPLATGIGLVMSALTTLPVAGYMSFGAGHWVGDVASDAGGMPILGWSRQAGDLRVAHFFATHAMQALPLTILVLPSAWRRMPVVVGISVAWLALTAYAFVEALSGRVFLSMLT